MKPTPEILAAIKHAAIWCGIPEQLFYAQAQQESGFNPLAESPCHARGLMQLMPSTAHELGLRDQEVFDISKNCDAGARYLKQMFKGLRAYLALKEGEEEALLWQMALAAYNGGIGYVLKAIQLARGGITPVRPLEKAPVPTWHDISIYLADTRCMVRGKRPDHKQIINYVDRIWAHYTDLQKRGENPFASISTEVTHG